MIYTKHQTGSKRRFAWIYSSKRWRALRASILKERGEQCESCYSVGEIQLHHRLPVSLGGELWNPDNLVVLCRSCHLEEHRKIEDAKLPDWQRKLYQLIDKPVEPRFQRFTIKPERRVTA